jgi:sigma-B regulation protein RsbU (phosphoserine phosphatase)
MPDAFARSFQARLAEFPLVRDFVRDACAGLSDAEQQRLVLILEELFCNSVEHGYGGDSESRVWITITLERAGCRIQYADQAREHNPFDADVQGDPLVDAGVEDRPVGGLGLFLVAQLSSSRRYERVGDRNVIEVELPWETRG